MLTYDKVWTNANIVTFDENNRLKILENYFLAVINKKITKIDSMKSLKKINAKKIINVENNYITPSLIDCHTHLVYSGNRANEFEMRLNGASYEEIAKSGGGINASIKGVRESLFEELYECSSKRLKALLKEGVTTVEIKTGYGLNTQSELKILEVAKKLEENFPVKIEKTFLGAHAVPNEYKNDKNLYINYVCDEMMPKIKEQGIASAVDVYCEHLAFNIEQSKKVFEKAKKLGLRVKLHTEQFSDIGGTKLAAKYNALSVDHLEYIKESSVKAIQGTNTVAVVLPGAFYFLRESKKPPIELFRKYNIPMAVATDLNPGTSPLCSLLLMLNMSSVFFGLSIDEAIIGVTKNAAKALGLENKKGEIKEGLDADFCIWDITHPRDLVCTYSPQSLLGTIFEGKETNV